jgi:hypothetical protein
MIAANMKCFKIMWKLIALVTVVAIASSVSVKSEGLITEEMELLGKKGNLRYGSMTDAQKAELFKKFESRNNRKVSESTFVALLLHFCCNILTDHDC